MNTRALPGATALLLTALGCHGEDGAPTEPAASTLQPAVAAAEPLEFRQLSTGMYHTCGVTTDNVLYCWGGNSSGELGDGTTAERATPTPVLGGFRFRSVSAGTFGQTCGVTTNDRAYCWGNNEVGVLGDGTTARRLSPTPVQGGLRFRTVSTGGPHTCGVTTDDRAYCWGAGSSGQLGNGGTNDRLAPILVAGGYQFRQVSAGEQHTCALTAAREAYCWGYNRGGQLGDSTTILRTIPVRVGGERRYRQLDAGAYHTCAMTGSDRAFCWGNGVRGQIGNGKSYKSLWPRRAGGKLYYLQVGAGYWHTCGVTTTNDPYCWGNNSTGALGDGTDAVERLSPVPVVGGLKLMQVSPGFEFSCGVTTEYRAYCWGNNFSGQLGDGTSRNYRAYPAPVAGPI